MKVIGAMVGLFTVGVVGCGHIQHVEPYVKHPKTCEEKCLQVEMTCLDQSSTGTNLWLFPPFVFADTATGEVVARHCELQGKLCRVRCDSNAPQSLDGGSDGGRPGK